MLPMRGSLFSPALLCGGEIGLALERAVAAVARLDARFSASSVREPWAQRAAWSGYARALQLHGFEIDEIDVFSWGSGVVVPGRPVRNTVVDPFEGFAPWRTRLMLTGRHWAEDLPFTLAATTDSRSVPLIARGIDLLAQWVQTAPAVEAWLALPILLHRLGLTERPLPCLVVGDRRLRWGARDPSVLLRSLLGELAERGEAGLKSLKLMEQTRMRSVTIVQEQRRPGALAPLLAMMQVAPVVTPEAVSRRLKVTLSGAGKLLQRAARLGLLHELSARRTWRVYLAMDLARMLGLVAEPRGRPTRPVVSPPPALSGLLSEFDKEMADWELRFGAGAIGAKFD